MDDKQLIHRFLYENLIKKIIDDLQMDRYVGNTECISFFAHTSIYLEGNMNDTQK